MLKIINKLFIGGDWNISLLSGDSFTLISNKRGYWYADPFLFEKNGVLYLFVEAFDKKKEIGRIGVLSSDSNFQTLNIVLSNDFHYSFPNVFSYGDDIYMIPESSEENGVFLYIFDSFPTNLARKSSLLRGDYVDTSLVKKEKDYYVFATYDNSQKCLLFFKYYFGIDKVVLLNSIDDSDKLLRPAGNGLIKDDYIILPFQYCANKYGEKIVFKKIKVIDGQFFIDGDMKELDSYSFDFIKSKGRIHTFNFYNDKKVIDYMNDRFDLFKIFRMLRRKIRRKRHKKVCLGNE